MDPSLGLVEGVWPCIGLHSDQGISTHWNVCRRQLGSKEGCGKHACVVLGCCGWCVKGRPNLFDLCFADDIQIFTVGNWIRLWSGWIGLGFSWLLTKQFSFSVKPNFPRFFQFQLGGSQNFASLAKHGWVACWHHKTIARCRFILSSSAGIAVFHEN